MNSPTAKTRKISIYEYFQVLQLEWINADLREKIYQVESDKQYWRNVKEGKKVKIENIAGKNSLPTIFDDPLILEELKRKIYKEKGYPAFIYKDDRQRAALEFRDMTSYFHKKIVVRYEIDGEIVMCEITYHEAYKATLTAKRLDNNEQVTLEVKECSRMM